MQLVFVEQLEKLDILKIGNVAGHLFILSIRERQMIVLKIAVFKFGGR